MFLKSNTGHFFRCYTLDLMIPVVTVVHDVLHMGQHIINYLNNMGVIKGIKDLFTITVKLHQLIFS